MIRVILRGCNGKMGQVISAIVAEDRETQLVAGVDIVDDGHNPYPVYRDIRECREEADCLIDELLKLENPYAAEDAELAGLCALILLPLWLAALAWAVYETVLWWKKRAGARMER